MSEYQVTDSIKEFILGGNAEFTILQEATQGKPAIQVKYKITIPKDKTALNTPVWYVSTEMSEGAEGVEQDARHIVYQGYLTRNMDFKVGVKGIQDYNNKAIVGLIWTLNHANALPSAVKVFHHGKCSVCGKKLTDARSLECGIGPTCRKKVGI